MKDQYGNLIPADLVNLDDGWLEVLTEADAQAINNLEWYEDAPTHQLLVSREALEKVLPFDAELPLVPAPTDVVVVDQMLHRYSDQDGWYHA